MLESLFNIVAEHVRWLLLLSGFCVIWNLWFQQVVLTLINLLFLFFLFTFFMVSLLYSIDFVVVLVVCCCCCCCFTYLFYSFITTLKSFYYHYFIIIVVIISFFNLRYFQCKSLLSEYIWFSTSFLSLTANLISKPFSLHFLVI